MTSLTGQSLGHYHIIELLGEGGMATVYKAYDTRLGREVALKLILPGRQQSAVFFKRFEREALTLADLVHPNIVSVSDYGVQDSISYLVMEYIAGGTLKDRMAKGPMDWREAARLLLPIARALEYAHKKETIHRDIKPANILMTESGEPMLSDFGIAKLLRDGETADLTGTGMGIGTPEYMAPEQALGLADKQSDIYALGVVYYELITGRKPYTANTPMGIMLKKNTEPIPAPSRYIPGLPAGVEAVLMKALAREPGLRHGSMAAFAADLQRIANPRSDLGGTAGAQVLPNLRSCLPWLAAAGGMAGLCIVAAAVLIAYRLFVPASGSGSPDMQPPTPTTVLQGELPTQAPPVTSLDQTQPPPDSTAAPTATLTPTRTPTTAPKAGLIAFSSKWAGSADIYVIKSDGSDMRQVTSSPAHEENPSWSPDGREIVFQTNAGGDYELAIVNLSSGAVRALTSNTCEDYGPAWSPRGDWIAFYSNCDGEEDGREIYMIRSNGQDRKQLTSTTNMVNWFPAWSPDGDEISFSSNRPGKYHIYTMDRNGSRLDQLAPGCVATYSPDGSQLAYGPYCTDTGDIRLMDTDGGNDRAITSGYECKNAAWSPDGAHLVFQVKQNGRYAMFIMDLNRPDPSAWVLLVSSDMDARLPVWQP